MSKITVTDVVDLIIEKKIKSINDTIDEKRKAIRDLEDNFYSSENEKVLKLKAFMEEHFEKKGLEFFLKSIMFMGMFSRRGSGSSRRGDSDEYGKYDGRDKYFYKQLFLMGLMLKGDDTEYETIKTLYDEIDVLENERYNIRNSKESLIAEVTLQQLSSVDADFSDKIEALTEKIFNNKQLN